MKKTTWYLAVEYIARRLLKQGAHWFSEHTSPQPTLVPPTQAKGRPTADRKRFQPRKKARDRPRQSDAESLSFGPLSFRYDHADGNNTQRVAASQNHAAVSPQRDGIYKYRRRRACVCVCAKSKRICVHPTDLNQTTAPPLCDTWTRG